MSETDSLIYKIAYSSEFNDYQSSVDEWFQSSLTTNLDDYYKVIKENQASLKSGKLLTADDFAAVANGFNRYKTELRFQKNRDVIDEKWDYHALPEEVRQEIRSIYKFDVNKGTPIEDVFDAARRRN